MRKIYFLLVFLILNSTFLILNSSAQPPQAIPYQAVARDNNSNLIANQNISLRFSIHDSIAAGTVVYKETQSATTNALGLFTVNIGQGTIVTGTFAGINWGTNAKFLQTEIDPTGGNSYVNMGTNQMMSVPYALNALKSNNGLPTGTANGNTLHWNGTAWTADNGIYNDGTHVGIGTNAPTAQLHTTGTVRLQSLSGTGYRPVYADSIGDIVIAKDSTFNYTGTNSTALSIPNTGCPGDSNTITLSGLPDSINSSTISVTLNITDLYDTLLYIFLTAPNGDMLNLVDGELKGANMINTVFKDTLIGQYFGDFIRNGTAPYSGIYSADGAYDGCTVYSNVTYFGGIGHGYVNPNGIWKLTIISLYDAATLNNWSISIPGIKISAPGSNNYIPEWLNGNLTNQSPIYDNNGDIGIGTTMPYSYNTPSLLTVNGYVYKPGGGSWASISDRRLKTNIIDYNLGLETLKKVHPVSYEYNGMFQLPKNTKYVGVIAQELKEIAPDMVMTFTGKDGVEYYSVDPSAFDYMLINAVKEQQSEIEELKAENASLKKNETVMKQDIEKIKVQLGMDVKAEK